MAHWEKSYSSSVEIWYLKLKSGGGRFGAMVYQETQGIWRISIGGLSLSGNHSWPTKEEAQEKAIASLLKMLNSAMRELADCVRL